MPGGHPEDHRLWVERDPSSHYYQPWKGNDMDEATRQARGIDDVMPESKLTNAIGRLDDSVSRCVGIVDTLHQRLAGLTANTPTGDHTTKLAEISGDSEIVASLERINSRLNDQLSRVNDLLEHLQI